MSSFVLQYIRLIHTYAVNLPLDIPYKERLSTILPYITWGLIWDPKTKDNKGISTLKVYTKPGKIGISQIVIY